MLKIDDIYSGANALFYILPVTGLSHQAFSLF